MTLYEFEYRVIPSLVQLYSQGNMSEGVFMNLKWNKEQLLNNGLELDFDYDSIEVFGKVLNEKYAIIVYTFPTPTRPPEAKYGAVVLNIQNPTKANYYTLKYSINESWILGSTRLENIEYNHYNFGPVQECMDKDDFAYLLTKQLSLYPSIENKIHSFFKRLFKRKSNG